MSYMRSEAPDLDHPSQRLDDPGAMVPIGHLDTTGFARIVEALRNGAVRHVLTPPPVQQRPYAAAGLRTAGMSLIDIAEVLGMYDPQAPRTPLNDPERIAPQIQGLVDKGLALLIQHDDTHRDALRQLTSARLDALLSAVWSKATDPEHPQQLTASRTAADIIDRYTRLHGLNAPTEHIINAPDAERIAEIIRQVAPQTQVVEADVFEVYPDTPVPQIEEAQVIDAEDVL